MDDHSLKRIFFAFNAKTPWPESLPAGRTLEEKERHLTLIFLGEKEYEQFNSLLKFFPPPPFKVGLTGVFCSCLALPSKHPRVIAWEIDWQEQGNRFIRYRKQIVEWLGVHGLFSENPQKPFTPHVTLARKPFTVKTWKKAFRELPVICDTLHLYESLGSSRYQSLWHLPLLSPIEEIEHTADIAFLIRAESLAELYWNASLALAIHFPEILPFCLPNPTIEHLDQIIIDLNQKIAHADEKIGSPYKAISFHDDLLEEEGVLTWEMIIDV